MMNSPWAMLMTFIRPNENASPRAINKRIELRLRPLNACNRMISTSLSYYFRNLTGRRTLRLFLSAHLSRRPVRFDYMTLVTSQIGRPTVGLEEGIGLHSFP